LVEHGNARVVEVITLCESDRESTVKDCVEVKYTVPSILTDELRLQNKATFSINYVGVPQQLARI
jgi:hypothetical protein